MIKKIETSRFIFLHGMAYCEPLGTTVSNVTEQTEK